MTIIIGLHLPGKGTWIGADSRTLCGTSIFPPSAQKITSWKSRALMSSGDGYMLTLIKRHKRTIFARAGADAVSLALVKIQKENDFDHRQNNVGSRSWGQHFIYATPAGVWDFDGCGSLLPVPPGHMWALGSGSDYALGCDHGLMASGVKMAPGARIELALNAACAFDVGCAPPFQIEHLK